MEIDPFCQKVLNKHWPEVPIIGDIKDATKEKIMAYTEQKRPILCPSGGNKEQARYRERILESGSENARTRGNNTIPPITLITGGFPCQPVSQAGKRKGEADDRWLWPDMLRVISEVRPTWVVAENVTGLLTMGFYDCLSDLESEGYETISFVIPACGINAPHRRDRIFIVAHYESGRLGQELNQVTSKLLSEDRTPQELESSNGDVADSSRERLQGTIYPRDGETERGRINKRSEITRAFSQANVLHTECSKTTRQRKDSRQIYREPESARPDITSGEDWWAVEPNVGRVAYGIPSRVDRLKALGNAVVPQQIYPILKAIADIETGDMTK